MIVSLFVRLMIFYILEGICLHFATIFENARLMFDTQFGRFDLYIIFGSLLIALFLTGWTLINDIIISLTAPGCCNTLHGTNHVQKTQNPGAVPSITNIKHRKENLCRRHLLI